MKQDLPHYKGKIIDLLNSLQEGLSDCKDVGYPDPGEVLYNRIYELVQDAEAVEDFSELTEVVEEAKEVETLLEAWLEREGLSSLAIEWPSIPSS
jgi:hypothetical protein